MLRTQSNERPASPLGSALLAALAAVVFFAVFAARHYSAVAVYLKGFDDSARVILLSAVCGLAVVSGVVVAFLRPRNLRVAFLAGFAAPALVFAIDPPMPDKAPTSTGKALSLALAPVSAVERVRHEEAARELAALRQGNETLARSEARLREENVAAAAELKASREERQTASDTIDRCRSEVLEAARRADALEADLSKLRDVAKALEAAAAPREEALALAQEKARAAEKALEKAKAELVRLQVRAADLEARLRPLLPK